MSFSNINLHIVFATKHRQRSLDAPLLARLIKYTGGLIRHQNGTLLEGGGAEDHLHLLVEIPPTCAPAHLLRDIKANTSRWMHETFPAQKAFAWQDGYSVFSVSRSAAPKVAAYIQNQQEHHKKMSWADEIRSLLERHGISYEERYL